MILCQLSAWLTIHVESYCSHIKQLCILNNSFKETKQMHCNLQHWKTYSSHSDWLIALLVFNNNFNYISVISWRPVLLVGKQLVCFFILDTSCHLEGKDLIYNIFIWWWHKKDEKQRTCCNLYWDYSALLAWYMALVMCWRMDSK
jgi:hypothetical protein